LDGRAGGQRPVPSLGYWSPQHAVLSPDGSEDSRPVRRKTEGRTDDSGFSGRNRGSGWRGYGVVAGWYARPVGSGSGSVIQVAIDRTTRNKYRLRSRAVECEFRENGAKTEYERAKKPCEEGEAVMRSLRGSGG
jgi:hypothetical protein